MCVIKMEFTNIYKEIYQSPTMRTIVNTNGDVLLNKLVYDLTCGITECEKKYPNQLNFYVEKYYDKTRIKCIILDFDGNNAYQDIMGIALHLKNKGVHHYVVDSTNKGYHLYILLPKPLNFILTENKRTNNQIFVRFVLELIDGDRPSLDKSNYGLFTRIRQLGSTHPKTGKKVDIVIGFKNYAIEKYYYNSMVNYYIIECFEKAIAPLKYKEKINNAIKKRSKYNSYESHVDLRTLFDGKSFDGGKSKWCKCRWHNDNKPSLHVYEKVAYCQVCGLIPFTEIKKEFNL